MTRIGFVADPHMGNFAQFGGPTIKGVNRRGQLTLDTFERACEKAAAEECDRLVILGDALENTKPTPQMLTQMQRIVSKHGNDWSVWIKGNHDSVSTAQDDHALGPLEPVGLVVQQSVITRLPGCDLISIPFQEGKAINWFPKAVAEICNSKSGQRRGGIRVLGFHLGVEDEETKHFLQGCADSIPVDVLQDLMEDFDISYCFAGNWHYHKHWQFETNGVCQVGTLTPSGWKGGDAGTEDLGYLAVFDVESVSVEIHTIPGPRFLDVIDGNVTTENLIGLKMDGHTPFVRIHTDAIGLADAKRQLAEWKEELGIEGKTKMVDAEQAAQARTAAVSAKASSTFEEATHAFVKTMPMPIEEFEGAQIEADRDKVLAEVVKRLDL